MDTLLLDNDSWDIVLDAHGNIALASEPYANAQDVASACRLFAGELYYDTTKGVPYFNNVLGYNPPLSLIKHELEKAALTVPDVVTAKFFAQSENNRELSGQIQVTNNSGTTTVVNLK